MSAVITDTSPTRFKLSVEQYHRMGEAGILGENDRVELIDGELIRMAPIESLHGGLVSRLTRLLVERSAGRAIVSPQNSPILSNVTEPKPDLSLLHWRADDCTSAVPVAADALLVIEVADSSLRYDRDVKLRFHAQSGVPEVWIVNRAPATVARLLRADRRQLWKLSDAGSRRRSRLQGVATGARRRRRVVRRGRLSTTAAVPRCSLPAIRTHRPA